ncbi:MAG: cytochrome c biogenesis protein ResB, partial [Dehalococcoidia bacterium]
LAVNIIVCTMNRWRAIWITVFRSRVRMTESFFDHARFNATLESPLGIEETARKMKRSLTFGRFRVSTENGGDTVAMLADKNRFSIYGTFLTHLSLVLILVGAVLGELLGYSDAQFIVAEGSTQTVAGTDLSLRLEHFADEYYLEGAPKDYRSEVTLFDGGRMVKEATIHVNSPLRYGGYTFYQSFYGQTAIMKVSDAYGNVIYSDGVPLAWQTRDGGRPVGGFTLPEQNISAWVVGPRSGENDPLINPGEMQLELYRGNTRLGAPQILPQGEPVEMQGLTYTFERESRFTGLKVAKDPGVKIIWIACTLMMVGMVMLFYFPRKRAWALLSERSDGTTEVRLAMPAQRDLSPAGEFRRLRTRVAKALGATPARDGTDGGQGGRDV